MILTEREKSLIIVLDQDGESLKFDDETRGSYQYEVEKPSPKEYRVSKWAIFCLSVEYFTTPEEVIRFIEK
jgi:hypothetical protein